jgi:hypothetical protein
MSAQIAIVESPDTLRLSREAQTALGIRAGSRISMTIEQGRVILEPLEEDDLNLAGSLSSSASMADELLADRKREARAKVDQIASELRSMFAGGPSLEDEYLRSRDVDKW